MPAEIRLFRCLNDNYGVLLHDTDSGATAAIDAPEAAPIEAALKATGWKLTDILVTHHHADHTGGIIELKEKHKCRVVAPAAEAEKIPAVDLTVREGDKVAVGKLSGKVIETPGHTNGHISYWFEADKAAFVGDTLFSIGCGRVIEGTPGMMWRSLSKLLDLLLGLHLARRPARRRRRYRHGWQASGAGVCRDQGAEKPRLVSSGRALSPGTGR
jgi:hydroxyacylglutathione hydrolase